jgi:hypothetical protein
MDNTTGTLLSALAAFDEAYGPERDERYYQVRQVMLVLAANLGVTLDADAPVVGLTLFKASF